VKLFSEAELK